MSKYLSDNVKKSIKEKIDNIESKSSAEIAVIVTDSCDKYRYTTFLYALLGALVLPALPLLFGYFLNNVELINVMVVTFFILFFLIDYSDLKYKLPTKIIKQDRCDKLANLYFRKMGIDKTKNKRAILIFVSIKEKIVKIIVDEGVAKVIENDEWKDAVDSFTLYAKKGKVGDGILDILKKSEKKLITFFPKDNSSEHKISNEVIEI